MDRKRVEKHAGNGFSSGDAAVACSLCCSKEDILLAAVPAEQEAPYCHDDGVERDSALASHLAERLGSLCTERELHFSVSVTSVTLQMRILE